MACLYNLKIQSFSDHPVLSKAPEKNILDLNNCVVHYNTSGSDSGGIRHRFVGQMKSVRGQNLATGPEFQDYAHVILIFSNVICIVAFQ